MQLDRILLHPSCMHACIYLSIYLYLSIYWMRIRTWLDHRSQSISNERCTLTKDDMESEVKTRPKNVKRLLLLSLTLLRKKLLLWLHSMDEDDDMNADCLHSGHFSLLCSSQGEMHSTWNSCLHGSTLTNSFATNASKQMEQVCCSWSFTSCVITLFALRLLISCATPLHNRPYVEL